MKKGKVTIDSYQHPNGMYSIVLSNIGLYQESLPRVMDIVKLYAFGDKLFIGNYKLDGINLSCEVFDKYSNEIPQFFKSHGKHQKIEAKPNKPKTFFSPKQELTICSAPNDSDTYEMLIKVFHYHLETIFFSPKINWNTFVDFYSNYTNAIIQDLVLYGYTDMLFAYVDSGDFIVTFNPAVHKPAIVLSCIKQIMQ